MSSSTSSSHGQSKLAIQLSHEYAQIFRNYKLSSRISPAVMVLCRSPNYLGRWKPGSREIFISERLCLEYDWGVVREVLKHEVAHQLVDEYMGGEEGSSHHGPQFQRACEMLGVAAWARRPRVDIDARRPSVQELMGEESTPVEKKISKLLQLSTSDNVHEARLALEKSQELRQKYLLEEGVEPGSGSGEDFHVLTFSTGRKTKDIYHVFIAHILVKHFGVQAIFTTVYDVATDADHCALEVLGRPRDLLMAEYIYHFLKSTTERLWLQHRTSKEQKEDPDFSARAHRNSFFRGVLVGFEQALERKAKARKAAATKDSHSYDLVAAADQTLQKSLKQYYQKRYPGASRTSYRTSVRASSLEAGKKLGEKLEIRSPIKEKSQSTPLIAGS